jgi:glycosyltransferase EpsD
MNERKRIKILFVASLLHHHILKFHQPYLKMLSDEGYDVHVFAQNDLPKDELVPSQIIHHYYSSVISRNPFTLKTVLAIFELIHILNHEQYDIVHCHTPSGGLVARLALSLSQSRNHTKLIYTAHGFHFYKGAPMVQGFLFYWVERCLANLTDVIVTINEEDFQRIQAWPVKKYRIHGIGYDSTRLQTSKIDYNPSFSSDELIRFISVGDLSKNKNHLSVVKALSQIKDLNYQLQIFGIGNQEKKLQQYINQHQLQNRVKLMGFTKNIARYLQEADVFILASFREGVSVSIMEALHMGLPVLCSDIRGNRELIRAHKNGLFFNPKQIESIQTAILDYIKHRNQFCVEPVKPYEVEQVKKEMKEIYDQLRT